MIRNVTSSLAFAVLVLVVVTGRAPAGVVWDGGGAAVIEVDTLANWDNDTLPDLTGGTSDLQFGSNGTSANINIAVSVNSFTFTRNANFSLERGAFPGYLTIGAGGLVGDSSGTSGVRTYTVKQHVTANGAQTWESKDALSRFSITGDVLMLGGALTLKTIDNGNSTITLNGVLSGEQAVNVIGRIILGASATYTGNTTIGTIGNVAGGIANPLPFGAGKGNIIMDNNNNVSNDAGVLGLGGFDMSINGLSGAGGTQPARILNNNASGSTTQTLTVGNNDATATFHGTILNRTSGSRILALTKVGSGTQILAGANTYTGTTTISEGTLQLGNGGTAGSLSSSSSIINNANLTINRSETVMQGVEFSGSAITGSGSLTQTGGGTLIINAANSYGGGTTLISGTLTVAGTSGALGTGAVTIQGTTAGTSLVIQSGVADAINNLALLSLAGGGTAAMADQGYANLVASDIIETVGSLTLGGNAQVVGLTYGSLTSGAAVLSDEYFAGTGRVVVGLAGDFNGDHSVDAADYVSWRANPSTFAGTAGYDLWRANFGTVGMGSGSSLSPAAVPEPATIVLLLVGMASLGLIGTGRRGKPWK